MTTITIRKNHKGAYQEIFCIGHAGFAKKSLFGASPDILCAAISVLVLNTINALDALGKEKLIVDSNEEQGMIHCKFPEPMQEKSEFLVTAMAFGLESLSKQYGKKYLQVIYEEV